MSDASAEVVEEIDEEEELIALAHARLLEYRADPVLFVRSEFGVEPDEWQKDALYSFRDNERTALTASKGPGKSAVKSFGGWWFMATHEHAQGFALSITADNLNDGLWKELAYWREKSAFLKAAFTLNADRIASVSHPKTWWLSARSFAQTADKEQQANTLAGLHAKNVFMLLDEVGDYPPGVLPAAEAIFATQGVNARILAGGNPTSRKGPLYRIVTIDAKRWKVIHISGDPSDPKRSPRISKEWAQGEIDAWGIDHPIVRVNVLGQFPHADTDQLINLDKVMTAMERDLPRLAYQSDPRIWGCDPATSGAGDEIVLLKRQGVLARRPSVWRGLDPIELATNIARHIQDAIAKGEGPDAIFIDTGGGGYACAAHLKFLGYEDLVHVVDFGSASSEPARYENRRVEMWVKMAEWCNKAPCCLPNDNVLRGELTAPSYSYETINKRTVLRVESKKHMKARGVPSPNRADALALTFAAPMAPTGLHHRELSNPHKATAIMRPK